MNLGGSVGVVMVSLKTLLANIQFGMLQASQVENQMTSVERILDYKSLVPEGRLEGSSNSNISKDSFRKKNVMFENVSLKYANEGSSDTKLALKDVNFTIAPGQRVLLHALFFLPLHWNKLKIFLIFAGRHSWKDWSRKIFSCFCIAENG